MAIQNFIGGGFKGKLGATIGQGWKNKKVIRTSFIPSNPRTAKQQTNRSNFAKCVQMAQFAMQMDFRSIGFSSEDNTEWALRISSARKYFNKDLPAMYCIPLIPYGAVAKYAVSDDFEVDGNKITFKIDTEDDLSGRGVSVLLYLKRTGTELYQYFVRQDTVDGTSGSWHFSALIPDGHEIGERSLACAVSNDDVVLNSKIYRSPFSIFNPVVDVPFTLTGQTVTPIASGDTKRTITFTPSVVLESAELAVTGVTATGILQGKQKAVSGAVVSASANAITVEIDTGVLDNLNQLVQFPAGCSVVIPAFSFTVGYNRYVYEGGTFSLSEVTVQQTFYDWSSQSREVAVNLNGYTFESPIDTLTGGVVASAMFVIRGRVTSLSISAVRNVSPGGVTSVSFVINQPFNYWGVERNIVTTNQFLFTTAGVNYVVPAGSSIPFAPYQTELEVNINNLSLSVFSRERDEYTLCYAIIGDSTVNGVASMWGSHAKPSVSITSGGQTLNVGEPSSVSDSDGIYLDYDRDAWWLPSDGTAVASFSEAFTEETTVENSGGFKLKLSVTVGSISGTYTFIPNE